MSEQAREGMRKLRAQRKSAGLCLKCGVFPPRPGVQLCVACAERQREWYQNNRKKQEHTMTNTICIDCKHAVPTADGRFGCEWSRSFQPVTGWVAVRRDLKVQEGAGRTRLSLSYKVESCPKFIEG